MLDKALNQLDRPAAQGRAIALAGLYPPALITPRPAHVLVTGLPRISGAAAFSRQEITGRLFNPALGYFDEILIEENAAKALSFQAVETLGEAESAAAVFFGAVQMQDLIILPAGDVAQPFQPTIDPALTVVVPETTSFSVSLPVTMPVVELDASRSGGVLGADDSVARSFVTAREIPVEEIAASHSVSLLVENSAYSAPILSVREQDAPIHSTASVAAGITLSAPLMAGVYVPGHTTTTATTTTTTTPAAAVDVSHIKADVGSEVVNGVKTIAMSSLYTVTANSANPTYLVLSILDRDEYTVSATGATGTINGNGHTASLSAATSSDDSRDLGIVFTYDASSGRYYNSTYGYFDAVTYTSSGSANDVTDLAVYATNSASVATKYAADTYALSVLDSGGYVSTVTVATETNFTGVVPSQATPSSIAALAQSFVGAAWNMDGCWTLASTIAAEAGASLPVASTYVGASGEASGEWIVAYNGPTSASSNWESQLKAGEFVVFETASGTGHITLVVSGSGSSAQLIDNIVYETSNGTVTNSAHDGDSSDVIISAAHSAAQEFAGVSAATVVIYELDTPIVSALVSADTLALKAVQSLSALFSIVDPASKSITEIQVYDTNSGDSLTVNGSTVAAHTAATAATAASLSAVSLVAGATAGTDTVEVRAYNGSYWGDWDTVTVTVNGSSTSTTTTTTTTTTPTTTTTTASSGITVHTTAAQSATDGSAYSFTLASNTFTDTAGLSYTTKAYQTSGLAVTSWLHYNATTQTLSGIVPTSMTGSITLDIIATDSAGHSASDIFSLTFAHGSVASISLVGAATSSTEHIELI